MTEQVNISTDDIQIALVSENAESTGISHWHKARRVTGRSRIARLLGVALGVSALVGITTAVSVLSVASTAEAAGIPPAAPPPIVSPCPGGAGTCGTATATYSCSNGFSLFSATASGGEGFIDVAQYSSDPDAPLSLGVGEYFDVLLSQANTFTSVAITIYLNDCKIIGGNDIAWWNGSSWEPVVGDPGPNYSSGSVTVTLNSTTSPSVAQLTGTPFAVTEGSVNTPPGGTTALSPGGTTTLNPSGGTTNYVVPTVS